MTMKQHDFPAWYNDRIMLLELRCTTQHITTGVERDMVATAYIEKEYANIAEVRNDAIRRCYAELIDLCFQNDVWPVGLRTLVWKRWHMGLKMWLEWRWAGSPKLGEFYWEGLRVAHNHTTTVPAVSPDAGPQQGLPGAADDARPAHQEGQEGV